MTDVKNNKWKPQYLVDWLLGGNLHIVITHPRQGMPQNWSMANLYNEFGRLYYHDGFPNEGKLSCPEVVFMIIILSLSSCFTNETIRLSLPIIV